MELQGQMWRFAATMLVLWVVGAGFACTLAEKTATIPKAVFSETSETININEASSDELMRIPFIGEKLAADIVTHREKYGRFRRTEQLLLLDGISDRRFREIRHLIRTD